MTIITRSVVPIACLAMLACAPAFDPVARLTNLRVLAIRAEPVNPGPGEITNLDALVYAPPSTSDQPLTYEWSWCPKLGDANDGYKCAITEEQLQRIGSDAGLTDVPPLILGTEPAQAFRNPFPTTVVANMCDTGFAGTPGDCEGGFPVRITLRVSHASEQRSATTVVRLPIADDFTSNVNPRFDPGGAPLTALIGGTEQPIDEQAAVTLPRLKETDLRAHVVDAEAESYLGLDDNDVLAVLRERLVLSWYVETGDVTVDGFHTGYFPGLTDIDQFLANKWKPGKKADFPSDQARIILVLRDNRGGVAWTAGAVGLEPTP
jgi:hypothetical protein